MTLRWSTIGLFVVILIQFSLSWARAKKTGKSFRSAVLPSALMAGLTSIVLARAFFDALPLWIDATLVILVSLVLLIVLALLLVQLRRYLATAWWLERKSDK